MCAASIMMKRHAVHDALSNTEQTSAAAWTSRSLCAICLCQYTVTPTQQTLYMKSYENEKATEWITKCFVQVITDAYTEQNSCILRNGSNSQILQILYPGVHLTFHHLLVPKIISEYSLPRPHLSARSRSLLWRMRNIDQAHRWVLLSVRQNQKCMAIPHMGRLATQHQTMNLEKP